MDAADIVQSLGWGGERSISLVVVRIWAVLESRLHVSAISEGEKRWQSCTESLDTGCCEKAVVDVGGRSQPGGVSSLKYLGRWKMAAGSRKEGACLTYSVGVLVGAALSSVSRRLARATFLRESIGCDEGQLRREVSTLCVVDEMQQPTAAAAKSFKLAIFSPFHGAGSSSLNRGQYPSCALRNLFWP